MAKLRPSVTFRRSCASSAVSSMRFRRRANRQFWAQVLRLLDLSSLHLLLVGDERDPQDEAGQHESAKHGKQAGRRRA
jgi:hypothetical protein